MKWYLSLGEGLFAQTAEWTANTLPEEQVDTRGNEYIVGHTSRLYSENSVQLASFPGPTQLPLLAVRQTMESWVGPWNEASVQLYVH